VIRAESPAALDGCFGVGTQVEIIPNHSCLTVPLFDEYHVIRGRGRWTRGRSLEGRAGAMTRHATAGTVSAVIEPTVPARFLPSRMGSP